MDFAVHLGAYNMEVPKNDKIESKAPNWRSQMLLY